MKELSLTTGMLGLGSLWEIFYWRNVRVAANVSKIWRCDAAVVNTILIKSASGHFILIRLCYLGSPIYIFFYPPRYDAPKFLVFFTS